MNILTTILAVLKLLALWLGGKLERDKERKKQLKEAAGEVKEAIKSRDKGALTRALAQSARV